MIYSATVQAKSGEQIPLFLDQKPMHSKYNPAAEAETFASQTLENFKGNFLIVAGIGAGFHIQKLIEKKPSLFILAVEADQESLDFSMNLEAVKNLSHRKNVVFTTPEKLFDYTKNLYLPAFYGNMNLVFNRAWKNFCPDLCQSISQTVVEVISEISSDYSVQAHFGKLWQKNILVNLKSLDDENSLFDLSKKVDLSRKAAIIAAGPTLDESLNRLIEKQDSHEVFSTDTALPLLLERNIIPSFVMNIDSQNVSHTHFLKAMDIIQRNGISSSVKEKTVFVFDISSNPETVSFVKKHGFRTFFTSSSHPLINLLPEEINLPQISSGSGTVTIAALDLAWKLGFENAELFGADFSYNSGKPYAKGTYLDRRFFSENNRIFSHENFFDSLMFRTEIFPVEKNLPYSGEARNPLSSTVLDSYRSSLAQWIDSKGFSFSDRTIRMKKNAPEEKSCSFAFNYNTFVKEYCSKLQHIITSYSQYEQQDLLNEKAVVSLLPLIAWLRKNYDSQNHMDFFEALKLAYSFVLRYTISYEK